MEIGMDIELKQTGWPLIELGYGRVEIGEGTQGDKLALIFGRNGTGRIGEATPPERQMTHEETLAVVTFANVKSLDVLAEKLQVIRKKMIAETGDEMSMEQWIASGGTTD